MSMRSVQKVSNLNFSCENNSPAYSKVLHWVNNLVISTCRQPMGMPVAFH